MKICWTNTEKFEESELVILGVPDESKSHALRKGTSEAPHRIREISMVRDTYKRENITSLGYPVKGISKRIYDYGNIARNQIENTIDRIISSSKIPITIGGDHSITTEIIRTISKKKGPLSLVYFDAHPDLVSSVTGYYGSVFYDVLPYIDTKSSVQIGIRTPEKEEIENIKKYDLDAITPFDIATDGIKKTLDRIMSKIGKNFYVSFDMDAIDPAYAPGVSVPVPLGINSTDATILLKSIAEHGAIGFDIMEVCPNYDIRDRTSHLASRMIAEIASSIP